MNKDPSDENEKKQRECDELKAALAEAEAIIAEQERTIDDLTAANRALVHRLSRNHKNSHVPSTGNRPGASVQKKKSKRHDNNSREKTGRKPGAQPGHPPHPRKKLAPTAPPVIHATAPKDIAGNPDWFLTDEYSVSVTGQSCRQHGHKE